MVSHTSEPCKNGCTDPDAVWVMGARMGRRNRVRWGSRGAEDVAIATNFGMQFAITGFVGYDFGCMIASDMQFDSRGGFSGQAIR